MAPPMLSPSSIPAAGIGRAQQAGRGHHIGGERRAAGQPWRSARAEAALVVGKGGMPRSATRGRHREGVAVIVEAVQGEDDRLDCRLRGSHLRNGRLARRRQ